MAKVKGKYLKGVMAEDFLDFSEKDLYDISKEQRSKQRKETIKKISSGFFVKRVSKSKGKTPKASVRGGIKALLRTI